MATASTLWEKACESSACVEYRLVRDDTLGEVVIVRGDFPLGSATISFGVREWMSILSAIKRGRADAGGHARRFKLRGEEMVAFRGGRVFPTCIEILYTLQEWNDFVAGVRRGALSLRRLRAAVQRPGLRVG